VIVKICGITNPEDARIAVDLGADALGFIFVPSSPRFIRPDAAAEILDSFPTSLRKAGVFVNAKREEILAVLKKTGINCLQLHGDELPDDTQGYSVPVWKAFRVADSFDPGVLDRYPVDAFVLDAFQPKMYGGTGKTFDWRHAVEARKHYRIILGGGLTPDNIVRAVETVRPFGVDVNSGVERSPGKKDAALLKKLFKNIKNIEHSL